MISEKHAGPRSMPKWAVPFVWAFGLVVLYGIAPWGLSLIGPRYGWNGGAPGPWNLAGLALAIAAFSILMWCVSLHYRHYQATVPLDATPRFLLLGGPYKLSRNPMYISDTAILLGWSLFYGSPALLIGCMLFAAFLAFVLVPSEERLLAEQFGDEYIRYRDSVPRWIGKPRPKY